MSPCGCWMCRGGRLLGVGAVAAMCFGLGHAVASGDRAWTVFFAFSAALWFVVEITRELAARRTP